MIDTRNGETYAVRTIFASHLTTKSNMCKNFRVWQMKVLDRKRVKKMRQERRLETEKQLLLQMNSPFICRLFAETEDDSAFYLLMELVQGGELQRLIHRKGRSRVRCLVRAPFPPKVNPCAPQMGESSKKTSTAVSALGSRTPRLRSIPPRYHSPSYIYTGRRLK